MTDRSLFLMPLLFAVVTTFGQDITRQDADSMIKALNKNQPGIDRVELLLNLAQFHIFKPGESAIDFDSAVVYIDKAKVLNKSIKSSSAYGYQLFTESCLIKERGKREEGKKMAEQAVSILETGSNKTYLGQAYYELSSYYDYADSLQYIRKVDLVEKAVQAYDQSGELRRKGRALEMLGDLYSENVNNEKAIPALKRALAAYDSINYPNLQGIYVILGGTYQDKQEFGQALFYDLKALKTAQALKDTSMQLCQIYNQLGRIYQEIGRIDMGLTYLYKALETAQRNRDENSVFLLASNIASVYDDIKQSDQALKVLAMVPKKYKGSEEYYDKFVRNLCYARAYMQLGKLNNAKPHCDTVLKIADKKLVPEQRRCNGYRLVATYYFKMKQYSKARYYLKESMSIVNSLNFEYGRIQGFRLAYELDSAQGNFPSAYKHLSMYKAKTDSISSERTVRQFQVMSVEYEVGMKEDSIRLKDKDILLLTEKNNLQQANLRRASLVKNVTIGGIVLAIIMIGLLYRQYRQKQKSNIIITQKSVQLQHYLTEKEWLLKEIHHRVKNNLQIVMSLLNSQSAYIDNESALTAIHDSQHRVHAMSLIHQKLYNTEDLSFIDMSLYIRELTSYLADSFSTRQRIRFELAIAALEMDVSQAVPLGLILNEAITNSIKYAFPNGREGVIKITLSNTSDSQYLLEISDNGIGIPSHLKNKKMGSLGMSLMAGLSEDLDGSFSIENNKGTVIKILFVHDFNVKRPYPIVSLS